MVLEAEVQDQFWGGLVFLETFVSCFQIVSWDSFSHGLYIDVLRNSYEDTSHIGSGLSLITSFNMNNLGKDSDFKCCHILWYWGLGLQGILEKGHHSVCNMASFRLLWWIFQYKYKWFFSLSTVIEYSRELEIRTQGRAGYATFFISLISSKRRAESS